jgi:1,4-dihydroxy-2-naphthoate polyprenyltransferase
MGGLERRTTEGAMSSPAQSDRDVEGRRPPAAPSPSAHTIWVDLLLYPTHSLPTAVAPVIVGAGLAVHDGVFAPLPVLVGFLGSWVIHVAGVFTDNHELLRKHPGLVEHPELTQAVGDGTLSLSTLRAAIAACLALALATAPYLHRVGGAPVLAFGAVGIAASLSYNGGPWAYVRRGLADPVFLLMFGVVAVAGTYFIQVAALRGAGDPWALVRSLPLPVFLVGLPAGAIVTSVMLVDDIRDHEFDAAKGWKTGAVRFGPDFNRAEIALLVLFAELAPIGFWLWLGFDAWVLLPLVSAPMAWATVKAIATIRERERLHPLSPRMAFLSVVHSVLLALGLALSR